MTKSPDITVFLDGIVDAAKRESVDLGPVKKAMKVIRSRAAKENDAFELWGALDEQIGKAKAGDTQQILIDLRSHFEEEWTIREIERLTKVFEQSPQDGWREWITILARAISIFRLNFAIRISGHNFPFPADLKQKAIEIKAATSYMLDGRWIEAYDQIEFIIDSNFIAKDICARLLIMLAEIELYHVVNDSNAKSRLDAAEQLAGDDGRVLGAIGKYWMFKKENQKARPFFERAITVSPKSPYGYTGMGEYFEDRNEFNTAEKWYLKAIKSAAGSTSGYGKLIYLYGRSELFAAREALVPALVDQAIAVGPEDDYEIYTDACNIYRQNKRYDEAHSWCKHAMELYPNRPGAYIADGICFEDEERFGDAESAYKKAIEVAPNAYDGYWKLTWLYEKQEKWESALEWYKKAPRHRKELVGIVEAKIGEMYTHLHEYSEAEKVLYEALRVDNENNSARNGLQRLADLHYKEHEDADSAKRIYDGLLAILGDAYKGSYHNRVGNLHYYYGYYMQAAEEYRQAIAVSPANSTFHGNLSRAYKQLRDYSQAAQELDRAFQIDKDENEFRKEMASLLNAEGNDFYARGNYPKAVQLYTEAIKNDDHDDVIYANLGGAWQDYKKAGKRLEALENAIEAYENALRIKPKEKRYEQAIARLERKKEAVSCYGEKALDWQHIVTPIAIEVAGNLIPYTENTRLGGLSEDLSTSLVDMRNRVLEHYGVKLPGVRIRGNETDLPDGTYIIMIMEVPLVSGTIALDRCFFPGSVEELSSLGIKGEETINPLTGVWINKSDAGTVEDAGLKIWGVSEYLVRHLEAVIQNNLVEFLGHQEVANLLEEKVSISLADIASRELTALTSVLRGLAVEGVPVRPLDQIYTEFHRLYSEGVELQTIVENLRSASMLRSQLPGNSGDYTHIPVGPSFQAAIRNAIFRTESHALLAMEPELCQDVLTAVRNGVNDKRRVALVTDDSSSRPLLRNLIELEFPQIPVLSSQELETDLEVKVEAVIELEDEPVESTEEFESPFRANNSEYSWVSDSEPHNITITVYLNDAFKNEQAPADDHPIKEAFSMMQDGLFYELGIILPEVQIRFDSKLEYNNFRFEINGREYPGKKGLEHNEYLVNDTVDRLTLLNIKGRETINPANGSECAILREDQASLDSCREAGLTTWGPAGYIVLTLSSEIRKAAWSFQTIDATEYIVALLGDSFPDLIDVALKRFSVKEIALVLRDLLREEISIRDLRSILESMLSINGTTNVDLNRFIVFAPITQNLCPVSGNRTISDLTTSDYSNFVRTSLKRYISHKYTRGGNTLVVYLLDRTIEERIQNVGIQPLTSEENARLKDAISDEVINLPPTAQNPVLLTTMDIRKDVRNLIESNFPNLAVLSYQELSPDMNIQPIARISWD